MMRYSTKLTSYFDGKSKKINQKQWFFMECEKKNETSEVFSRIISSSYAMNTAETKKKMKLKRFL